MTTLLVASAVGFAGFAVMPPHHGGWKIVDAIYVIAAVAFAIAAVWA